MQHLATQCPLDLVLCNTLMHSGTCHEVQELIKDGANVNTAVGKDGHAPLHIAAQQKQIMGVIELLIAAGANINAANKNGHTPLHIAATCDNVPAAKLLIAAGATVTTKSTTATPAASTAMMERPTSWTALHAAARAGSTAIAGALIETGASVDALVEDRHLGHPFRVASRSIASEPSLWTSLSLAAAEGCVAMVRLLLDAGANVEGASGVTSDPRQYHTSPLSAATGGYGSSRGRGRKGPAGVGAVKLLIAAGASLHLPNGVLKGRTPLHSACILGCVPIVEVLIRAGAPLDVLDERGDTPLICAVSRGVADGALLLIEAGASVDVRSKHPQNGLTAFEIATDIATMELQLLRHYNKDGGLDENHKNNTLMVKVVAVLLGVMVCLGGIPPLPRIPRFSYPLGDLVETAMKRGMWPAAWGRGATPHRAGRSARILASGFRREMLLI